MSSVEMQPEKTLPRRLHDSTTAAGSEDRFHNSKRLHKLAATHPQHFLTEAAGGGGPEGGGGLNATAGASWVGAAAATGAGFVGEGATATPMGPRAPIPVPATNGLSSQRKREGMWRGGEGEGIVFVSFCGV